MNGEKKKETLMLCDGVCMYHHSGVSMGEGGDVVSFAWDTSI